VCVCVRIYHNQTPLTIWENRIYDIYVLVLLLLRLHVKEKNLDKIGGCSGCRLRKTLSACNWVQETWTMTYMTLRKSVGVGCSATCKLETVKMMAFCPYLQQVLCRSCICLVLITWAPDSTCQFSEKPLEAGNIFGHATAHLASL
jgi:hypothetical protein